jgi:hypothetical protein
MLPTLSSYAREYLDLDPDGKGLRFAHLQIGFAA